MQQAVVVLGSRSAARTALDAAAPVGLIGAKDMQMAGPLELGKLLQTLDPSFNFSTTFISDGTDIIRPATLRSLGPDQLLVLVNGKRRHQQALVNVQQTIGRGSAGTDINAIPLSAIQRIEVLRDGAAAQYGSDAIAGVINIVLKQQTNETQLSGSVGGTTEGGGELYSGSANKGWALGDGGYVNLTVEGRRRGETNRAGLDTAARGSAARDPAHRRQPGQGQVLLVERRAAGRGTRRRVLQPSAASRTAPAIRPASSAPPATAATCRRCTRTASCRTSAPP
jgi:iron complex outermembrane receptor protein